MKYQVIPPALYEGQAKTEKGRMELEDIQRYMDGIDIEFPPSSVLYMALKGRYTHINRSMFLIGVLINNSDKVILGLDAQLRLKLMDTPADAAKLHLKFPPEFVGKLGPAQAMLIHLSVPVRGLDGDAGFEANQITSSLDAVQVLAQA